MAGLDALVPAQGDLFGLSIDLLVNLYELVGAVLGLFIAYLAYRGYRRNDSRPMLFIAIGFATILGVPTVLFFAYYLGLQLPETVGQAVVQTFEIAGLLAIIYALRMDA